MNRFTKFSQLTDALVGLISCTSRSCSCCGQLRLMSLMLKSMLKTGGWHSFAADRRPGQCHPVLSILKLMLRLVLTHMLIVMVMLMLMVLMLMRKLSSIEHACFCKLTVIAPDSACHCFTYKPHQLCAACCAFGMLCH